MVISSNLKLGGGGYRQMFGGVNMCKVQIKKHEKLKKNRFFPLSWGEGVGGHH